MEKKLQVSDGIQVCIVCTMLFLCNSDVLHYARNWCTCIRCGVMHQCLWPN